VASFELQIAAWVKKAKGNADAVVRKVELDISTRVIMATPVDTGRARGNWNPSIGQPDTSTDAERKDPAGGATVAAVAGVVESGPASGRRFYLMNNLPYIIPLEYGWSKQAPSGMVRLAVQDYRNLVSVAVDEVKNK
jgi:hypothetical protein